MRSTHRLVVVLLLAAALAAGASSAPPANGASFTVNSTADTVDAAPGDGVCADATGACTLRAAVLETNALPGTDAINVPAGAYLLTIPGGLNPSPGGTVGALSITDDLSVSGSGPGTTIIDGNNYAGGTLIKLNPVFFVTGVPTAGPAPTVELRSMTIQHGIANVSGGGILSGGNLTVRNVVIRDNQASQGEGGGIAHGGGQLTVVDSTITSNGSQGGGGIFSYSPMALVNVTISDNTGVEHGGGIYSGGSASLVNVTIANNGAKEGGGIVGSNVSIKNTIISGNGIVGNCVSPLASLGHNVISDASCNLTGPGDQNGVDPMLGPLADNGGPTQTHALLAGSPAINAGDNNGCPATDQRGVARPQQGTCDIGAYEYVPPATPAPTPKPAVITASPAPSPTAAPTDSATPTARPSPSPSRTPKRSRTASPTALPSSDEGGGGTGLIIGLTLGGLAVAAAGGGGGYYAWQRRRSAAGTPDEPP